MMAPKVIYISVSVVESTTVHEGHLGQEQHCLFSFTCNNRLGGTFCCLFKVLRTLINKTKPFSTARTQWQLWGPIGLSPARNMIYEEIFGYRPPIIWGQKLPIFDDFVLLPERDYVTFGSLLSQFRLSSVCPLSSVCLSVCNVGALYSGGWSFRQNFFTTVYAGHPLTSMQKFTEIVPWEPLRRDN